MFVYHQVPDQGLEGTVVYPLNALKASSPEAYARHMRKYDGRTEDLPTSIVPRLGCTWADVIFLSPVHPAVHRAAFEKEGLQLFGVRKAYEIPISMLDPARTVIWRGIRYQTDPKEYLRFGERMLSKMQGVPRLAFDFARSRIAQRLRPHAFAGIPHILHQGEIDITGLAIV